jgi:TolC family type I secretion outer membrane protein
MNTTSVATACAVVALVGSISNSLASPVPQSSAPAPVREQHKALAATSPASPLPASISLSQAESIALASSPQLALARASVDQAQAGVGIARSGELPDIRAQASSGRARSNFRISSTSTAPFLSTQNGASVTLNQLILDGGRVNAEVQAARFSTDAAKLTLLRDVQTVLLTVAAQYYAALQARHQLEAAQSSLKVAQVQEKLVEAQYHAGVASKADVLTAQLPVAQAEVTVASAQNGEAENVASLLTTMGVPATQQLALQDDTAVSPSNAKLEALVNSALTQRTDLSAARAGVSQAQASVRAAKLALFPLIGGTATTGTTSTAVNGTNYLPNWSVGASISFPIYTGGLIGSQINQARAVKQAADANLKATELNVYLNVQQAYLSLSTASSSLNAAKVALDQAQVVLNVTNAQYKAGVTTLPLLLNAQSQLTTARSNYIQSLYSYKLAQQNLLFAEGTLSPS